MHKYIIRRILMLLVVIISVSFIIFTILDFAPGDPAVMILGADASEAEVEALRERLGLNDPLLVRYARYMLRLFRGDLGFSYHTRMDVWDLYMQRLPNTVRLATISVLVSMAISIPLGIYSAIHRGKLRDNIASVFTIVGVSAPNFWVGLMLIIVFALKLGWFPSGGIDKPGSVVLPAVTIGTSLAALLARTTRSTMLDVIRQDYLLLARAKGVSERKVIRKHALKNALIPIITVIGIQLGRVIGGSVVTEAVFAWPGVGRLIIEAISNRDIDTLLGAIIMTTIFVSVIMLVVDILYAFVNPRVRAQYSSK
jgi:peptide/nickel transport system permease protein